MTDDKLREACERVAKAWLGWVWDADKCWWVDTIKNEVLFPSHLSPWKKEDMTKLASPWGMDLLLDAVEKRKWDWRAGKNDYDHNNYFAVRRPYKEGSGNDYPWITGNSENRYAALVFALDKVGEVLDEAI